jgi:hypothetical protein
MPETCNPEGGNLAKWKRSPGATTVWQPGAAPPDINGMSENAEALHLMYNAV